MYAKRMLLSARMFIPVERFWKPLNQSEQALAAWPESNNRWGYDERPWGSLSPDRGDSELKDKSTDAPYWE